MTYFRKLYVTTAFLLITSMGYTYEGYDNWSDGYDQGDYYGESEDYFCCQPDCCCGCNSTGGGFLISADLLYWRPFESGLDRCVPEEVSNTIRPDGRVISTFNGKSRDPHFKWSPGFRICAGYGFDCSHWDIGACWTHFHSHANSSNHGNKVQWNINLDVIDILAGYKADLGPCFSLRPFFGIRGARIDQKLHLCQYPSSSRSSRNELDIIGNHNKQDFSGIGPIIGLGGDWNIGCGFSLYASGAISWLYGRYDVRFTDFDDSIDAFDCCYVKKHLNANLAAADAALGIRWQTCFCMDTRLVLQLGLEHHRYFDYNRMGNYGDLSFDGVNFSAGIEF